MKKTSKKTTTTTSVTPARKWINCTPISTSDYFAHSMEFLCALSIAQLDKYKTQLLHTTAHALFAKWCNGGLTMQESIDFCKNHNKTCSRGSWGENPSDIAGHYNWLMKTEKANTSKPSIRFIPIAWENGKIVTSENHVKEFFNTILEA